MNGRRRGIGPEAAWEWERRRRREALVWRNAGVSTGIVAAGSVLAVVTGGLLPMVDGGRALPVLQMAVIIAGTLGLGFGIAFLPLMLCAWGGVLRLVWRRVRGR